MEGKSLKDELLEFFGFDNATPSNSSFNQRRAQILPEAFDCEIITSAVVVDKSVHRKHAYQIIKIKKDADK